MFQIYSNGKKVEDGILIEKLTGEEAGIFESMCTYGGRLFRLEEHLRRLNESARTAGLDTAPDLRTLRGELQKALQAFGIENRSLVKNPDEGDVFVRLTIFLGRTFVMIGWRRHVGSIYKNGVKLRTTAVKRSLAGAEPGQLKTSAYHNALMANLEWRRDGVEEGLMLDSNGFVTEVSVGNIFLVKAERLATPPVLGILNGVTRNFVIECARFLALPVVETPLTRHDFFNAEEVFLTNTSWEILPVRELDGRKTGTKIPGPWTLKLHRLFKERVHKECLPLKSAAP